MNKKGYFFSITNMLLMFCLLIGAVALVLFQNNPEARPEMITSNLNWSHIGMNETNNTINALIEKTINFIGESMFLIAKEVTEWAYNNQTIIDGKTLIYLIIFFLIAPLIYPTFIIIVSLILIFREWRAKRKENRLLKKHE